MPKSLHRFIVAFAGIAATVCGLAGLGFASEACPPDAEQRLFDKAQGTDMSTVEARLEIETLVDWAIENCVGRGDAQGLAAILLSYLMQSTRDLEAVSRYASKSQTAFQQMAYGWSPKHDPVPLTTRDGKPFTFFTSTRTGDVITGVTLPTLIALGRKGKINPMISGAPLAKCPYPKKFDSSLSQEAKFWTNEAEGHPEDSVFGWASSRLVSLEKACPEHAYDLNFYLALLYGQEVERLTAYTTAIEASYGSYTRSWRLKANGQYYANESKFKKDHQAFMEIARPLAETLRQYIADYRGEAEADRIASQALPSYSDRKYSDDIRFERADFIQTWEKAIALLDKEYPAPQ